MAVFIYLFQLRFVATKIEGIEAQNWMIIFISGWRKFISSSENKVFFVIGILVADFHRISLVGS